MKRRFACWLWLFCWVSVVARAELPVAAAVGKRPRLVVLLAVDQLRSDFLPRLRDKFLPPYAGGGQVGGYRYLMERGAYYPNAQYGHLHCMTGPGHATLLTGAYPYQAGIPLNEWFDAELGKKTYCVEDEAHPQIGGGGGYSPKNLRVPTLGDELKNAGYASKVVSLALKDRASIFMGGFRADTALWFDANAFRWTSSTFYHPDGRLPGWVVETNAAIEKKKGKQFAWNPEFLKAGGSGWEGGSGSKNRHASWTFGDKESLAGPIGIELTVELAEKAIRSLELGQDAVPDLLAVSLSSHDYLAHDVGPNSQWINALTLYEDKQIARLLNLLRETVPGGLASVVVVLTADHGIPPDPDWLVKQRVPAGRFDEDVVTAELEDQLRKKFGKAPGGKWVAYGGELNFSWEPRVRATEKPGVAVLEGEAKRFFAEKPWAAHVVVRSDLEARRYPPELLGRQVARTFVPGRSGDVIVVPKPFYFPGPATVTHVTGYAYDRTIPLVFAGDAFRAGLYGQPADAVDIAPTLAFLLGIVPPAGSEGRVLDEALKR
jgi:arylsulfatase A-like enzyme